MPYGLLILPNDLASSLSGLSSQKDSAVLVEHIPEAKKSRECIYFNDFLKIREKVAVVSSVLPIPTCTLQ